MLLTTLRKANHISERNDKKPQIILEYNHTKGAVDTADQIIAVYSCSGRLADGQTKFLFNRLDIGSINAFVIS